MTESNQPISTSFIGYFNDGDNIVFNFKILDLLYKNLDKSQPPHIQAIVIKPIVLIGVALIEALMFDFVNRIQAFPREPMKLDWEKKYAISKLDTDRVKWKFHASIEKFSEQKVLGNQENYYANLHYLRNLRNRIHIQNRSGGADEYLAWTSQALRTLEACVEYTLLYLSENYRRDKDFVKHVQTPWERHFPPGKSLQWEHIYIPSL